jgi:hypothetical protein
MLLAAMGLSACGSTPADRGLSGAGIGATTGAVLGAVTGMSVVQGVVLGAAAGGLTGALTRKDQINLGEPAWKQHRTAASAAPAAAAPGNRTVLDIQVALARAGLYHGPADGLSGPKTRAAIRAYQRQNGLLVDGRASAALLAHLRQRHLADR